MWQDAKTDRFIRLFILVGLSFTAIGYVIGLEQALSIRHIFVEFRSEALSILITVLLVDILIRQRLLQFERERLISQISSPRQDVASEAIRILRRHQSLWTDKHMLRGRNFSGGNLPEAQFVRLNLSGSSFWDAELHRAYFSYSNLEQAQFANTNLQGASFKQANLEGASFWFSSLAYANLNDANLQEVDFTEVNLQGARVRGANFKEANLRRCNLYGIKYLTAGQLKQASNLSGSTLPDGTELPTDDDPISWQEEFEQWLIWSALGDDSYL